ncbi:expressed unknown protein [Seminavis robusta]|uniref:Uncharacterized protein n=1 Tax=Seminavis robusta TaxID=568900 RepID=A0A9N8HST8_9STRA|nr:expressed unknown protein [Seminavis robusta]|eukprot:Sro1426_g271720.1 n/a (118) ;mRNA; f:18168-18521
MHAKQSISIAAPASVVWDLVSEEYGGDLLSSSKRQNPSPISSAEMEDSLSDLSWTVERVSESECRVRLETPVVLTRRGSSSAEEDQSTLDPVQCYLETLESLSGLCQSIKTNIERNC